MTFNAELVLAGPRGRRLCLEVAAELDPDVRNAVFQLGYELDPGRGTSVVMFGDLSKDAGSRPAASADALAALLGSMDVPDLTEDRILDALHEGLVKAVHGQLILLAEHGNGARRYGDAVGQNALERDSGHGRFGNFQHLHQMIIDNINKEANKGFMIFLPILVILPV